MTYRRVVSRNGLTQGDYGKADLTHWPLININNKPEALAAFLPEVSKYIQDLQSRLGLLLGDLRRLEHDTQDEGSIARQIQQRTGIDSGVIAAVLKEYINL